jgi:hypothetical protein
MDDEQAILTGIFTIAHHTGQRAGLITLPIIDSRLSRAHELARFSIRAAIKSRECAGCHLVGTGQVDTHRFLTRPPYGLCRRGHHDSISLCKTKRVAGSLVDRKPIIL